MTGPCRLPLGAVKKNRHEDGGFHRFRSCNVSEADLRGGGWLKPASSPERVRFATARDRTASRRHATLKRPADGSRPPKTEGLTGRGVQCPDAPRQEAQNRQDCLPEIATHCGQPHGSNLTWSPSAPALVPARCCPRPHSARETRTPRDTGPFIERSGLTANRPPPATSAPMSC